MSTSVVALRFVAAHVTPDFDQLSTLGADLAAEACYGFEELGLFVGW